MIGVANEIMSEGFSDTNDIFDLLNKTEQSFFISEKKYQEELSGCKYYNASIDK